MPQILTTFPPMIDTLGTMRTMMLTMHSTMSGIFGQMEEISDNATAMGKTFDAAKNDDSFYLPPEVFDNPDFKRAMKIFLSPDGKAVRMIISHRGNPATVEGVSHIDKTLTAAEEALKGTPLENAKIYLGGTAAMFKHMRDGSNYDLMIAGIASLCLIFIIMLLITGALVAALVIVGTVALSLGYVVRAVGAALAARHRHGSALAGAGDVRDHPAGRGIGLQPAAGRSVQRGDPRRDSHRDHPGNG
jgi:RND superfamily putative drug exporter